MHRLDRSMTYMYLEGSQSPESIIQAALKALVRDGILQETEAIEAVIWEREQRYSTYVGQRLAMPHGSHAQIPFPHIVGIQLAEPCHWFAAEAEVTLVILFLIPQEIEGHEAQLEWLKSFAGALGDEVFLEGLQGAKGEDEWKRRVASLS